MSSPAQRRKSRAISRKKAQATKKSRYLIRSNIAQKREDVIGNKYFVPNAKARNNIIRKSLLTTSTTKALTKPIKSDGLIQKFCGTIIYKGDSPLHPYKWVPNCKKNQPSGYKWVQLLDGTQVFDQNTRISWVIERNHSLSLHPCQTIEIRSIGENTTINNFNPALCLDPILPERNQIPVGTVLKFSPNHLFKFDSEHQLQRIEPQNSTNQPPSGQTEVNRQALPRIIPVAIDTNLGQEELVGIGLPVPKDGLLRKQPDGYPDLESWLNGLIVATKQQPIGLLDSPIKLEQLIAGDLLEFYDPNFFTEDRFRIRVSHDQNHQLYGQEVKYPMRIVLNQDEETETDEGSISG